MPVAMRTTYQKAEAKYNVTTEFPSLGLHSAAATGNVGLVEYALDHGQPINSVLDGVLPLHAACAGGNVQVVKLLIDHGADVNAPRLPRRYSNDKNRDSSAPIVGTSGSTPLHFAAANGNTEVVNLLLLHGAHADRSDKHGVTPEMLARQHGWLECADVLKQWLVNKDRDLRERPGGTTPNDPNVGPSRERIGSFSSDAESQTPSTRRRLLVKHSIDNALNKLKSSTTDIRLHPPSSSSVMSSTPPASPTKPFGEYTFVPISPTDGGVFDPGARRPSLPHILQPSSIPPSRSRKISTPSTTHSPSPRRPRSAGNGAEGQETEVALPPPGKVRKLGSKYSLMNIFKKAQSGGDTVQSSESSQSLSAASPLASGSTTTLPMSSSPSQPSPLSHSLATEFHGSTSTRSGLRIHRGSDASPRTTSQSSNIQHSLNRKVSGTMPQSPRPLAIDLHNAVVHERQERSNSQSRDRSRSTGSGARFTREENSPSPGSSPLQRLGLLRAQGHRRDRSGSGSSLGTSSTPGYRGGAVFDDDVVVVAGDANNGEPGRSSSRPSILKAHARTSSGSHVPGTPAAFRALRFDSSSSINASVKREGEVEGLRRPHILRGSNSVGSLGRRRVDIFGRGATPEPRVSEENLAPDSAPAAMSDFNPPRNAGKHVVADEDEDEDEYGQPLGDDDSPIIDSGEVKSQLLLRERGFASSSQSSLSPIMTDAHTINTEFPFSINQPVTDAGEIEPTGPVGDLLRVPSAGDNRSRGDSVSSTSTSDSNNPQLSASGTTSGSGSETVTTPWLSSPGRDEFLDVARSPGAHDVELHREEFRPIEPPDLKLINITGPTTATALNERRHHIPPDINIGAISSHAQAEAMVQKAQQDILEMAQSNELTPTTGSTGRSPLSARLAAYGESLALERKLREKKEQEERQVLEFVRPRTGSSIRSPATTPTRFDSRLQGVERQHSLGDRPNKMRVKSKGKDPKRPSTAEGLAPRSMDQEGYFQQSSKSVSGLATSPPNRLLSIEPDTPSDEQEDISPAVSKSASANLSILPPKREPSPAPRIVRSRTPVPDSSDGHLSRISSHDCGSTDTELGPSLLRVSTAPHGAVRGAKTSTKLTRMGFPPLEQVRTPPSNNKRFGAIRSLVQTLKGKS